MLLRIELDLNKPSTELASEFRTGNRSCSSAERGLQVYLFVGRILREVLSGMHIYSKSQHSGPASDNAGFWGFRRRSHASRWRMYCQIVETAGTQSVLIRR